MSLGGDAGRIGGGRGEGGGGCLVEESDEVAGEVVVGVGVEVEAWR